MTELPPIAIPKRLCKGGLSGAGGQPTTLKRIRRDIFQMVNMLYELEITGAYAGSDPKKTMIIDLEYDGYVEHDPQSSRPMSFVTDDPEKPGRWLGTFKAPNSNIYGENGYSDYGTHTVKISVAPRVPPMTQSWMTIIVPKDDEVKIVRTTKITKIPVYGEGCGGKTCIIGYKNVEEIVETEVPAETEIEYEGYSVHQVLAPRDFSPEAGGVTKEFTFEIFPEDEPPYKLPKD